MTTTLSANGPTNWKDIRDEIERRIRERVWAPGDLLPAETELAGEFGCARATINRALQDVASSGLIDRKRKAGTRVATTPVRKATLEIPITRIEIESQGHIWSHRLVKRELCAPPPFLSQQAPSLPPQILHTTTVHFSDDRPYLLEDRWTNPDAARGILDVDLTRESANEWLVRNAPFSRGDIALSASAATTPEARLMQIDTGTALFTVERRTWIEDALITSVRLLYAPGYRMTSDI